MDRRMTGRLRLQRKRWRAGDRPARLGGAGLRLGVDPQQHDATAGRFRRQNQATAGRQVEIRKSPFRLHEGGRDRAGSHDVETGPQHVHFAGGVHHRQPFGLQAKGGQTFPEQDKRRLSPATGPQDEQLTILVPPPHGEREGQGGGAVIASAMYFVHAPGGQRQDGVAMDGLTLLERRAAPEGNGCGHVESLTMFTLCSF